MNREISRQEAVIEYGLTHEEAQRLNHMKPEDPVADFFGYPDIQAQMLLDERETIQQTGAAVICLYDTWPA